MENMQSSDSPQLKHSLIHHVMIQTSLQSRVETILFTVKFNQPLRAYVETCLVIVVLTLAAILLRETLTLANFIMFYLLTILIIGIRCGTVLALIAASVSFLCINYFLVTPLYTLAVADPRDLLDLFIFLIVAGLSGQLGAHIQRNAISAQQYAREQEILYRLTRAFNQLTTEEGVYAVLINVVQKDLSARQASIDTSTGEPSVSCPGVYELILKSGDHTYGTLNAMFDHELITAQFNLLSTCVFQAAQALERIDLMARASKSRQFEEADKLKTAILYSVSHDLRTPVTIIKTSANNLQRLHGKMNPADEVQIAETIEHEADQLDKLVGNLLDMSRLQAGSLSLNCQQNSLEEMVGDAVARVWERTKQKRISLSFEEMPLIDFDYGLMLQAVSNLIDNSLRYEPADRQIEIRGLMHDDEARLDIINHGETIPDELKERVMEPFYRGSQGRTGLGLPIAKGIIEAHQGRLWVEDTQGGGATFVVTLPYKKDSVNED